MQSWSMCVSVLLLILIFKVAVVHWRSQYKELTECRLKAACWCCRSQGGWDSWVTYFQDIVAAQLMRG